MLGLNYLGTAAGPGMPGAVPGASKQPPPAVTAPAPAPGGGFPLSGLMPTSPTAPEYKTVTQQDGTVLLHVLNPDGSLGPAVKIVSPPRPKLR